MYVRLGYVAMSLKLEDASPSKTITLTNILKINDYNQRLYRLRKIASTNLQNTLRILAHNQVHDIQLYRFTSKLVPLATHPEFEGWNYIDELRKPLEDIGVFVKKNDMRVSAHPDHFTLLNSPQEEVLKASIKDLQNHNSLFDAMGLDEDSKLILHVGGHYKNKLESLERFKMNFKSLPDPIRLRIILENDDKTYSIGDVLPLCNELGIPMVLDVHHHYCNNSGEDLQSFLPHIFDTWNHQKSVPKIHFSSPKSEKQFRSHADNICTEDFVKFLRLAKKHEKDFDIMLEAKNKDVALFHLMDELKNNNQIKIISQASLEV